MIEALLPRKSDIYPWPGDQYLGEVTSVNFIDGVALASMLGLTSGQVSNSDAGWLKFKKQEGETLLVAKKTLRYRLSWNQLEAALIMYGERLISVQGNTYKVRLLRGAEKDPTEWNTSMSQNNPPEAAPSEWNRLIHRVAVGNPGLAPNFVAFPLSDLSIAVSATGRMTLCQETLVESATTVVARGNTNLSVFNYVLKSDGSASSAQDHYGWRPVLELVGPTKYYPGSGPGSKTLAFGNEQLGFFGEVAASEMVTNTQLKTHLGHAAGTARADQGWLKFFYKGKVIFIGKNTYCSGLTWNNLYAAGGIYGTNDNGKYPAATPVNQYKPLTWNSENKVFKLIPRATTMSADPFENGDPVASDNEYSDLLGRLMVNVAFPGSGQWGRYTAAQLNMNIVHMGPGTRGSAPTFAAIRGYTGGTNYTSLLSLTKADASGYNQHFRMTLVVEGDPNVEPISSNWNDSFTFDPGSSGVSLSGKTNVTSGVIREEPPSIGDVTVSLPLGNLDNITWEFDQPLDLSARDWTLEWSSHNEASVLAGYVADTALLSTAGLEAVCARYGNSGYGERFQLGGNMATAAVVWNSRFTKSAVNGVLKNYALVSVAGQISLYVDGVKEMLANGTSSNYTAASFASNASLTAVKYIRLGGYGANAITMPAKRGKARFSLFARYSDNYTPTPF